MENKELAILYKNKDTLDLTMLGIRPLSKDEYYEIDKAIKKINKLESFQQPIRIVQKNYQSFLKFISQIDDFLNASQSITQIEMREFLTESNRLVMNILFSFTAYTDHMKQILPENNIDKFNKSCSRAYDENFSYRFICRLRHHAQHRELPIGNIEIKQEVQNEKIINTINIFLVRDQLVNSPITWSTVKKDLLNQKELFSINPLLREAVELLTIIDASFFNEVVKNLVSDSELMNKYLNEVNIFCLQNSIIQWYPIIVSLKQGECLNSVSCNMIHFPLDILNIVNLTKE